MPWVVLCALTDTRLHYRLFIASRAGMTTIHNLGQAALFIIMLLHPDALCARTRPVSAPAASGIRAFQGDPRAEGSLKADSIPFDSLDVEGRIDYLLLRRELERENGAVEVRRSLEREDGILDQCAYEIGAMRFRALHAEAVDSGKMSNREGETSPGLSAAMAIFRGSPGRPTRAWRIATGQRFDRQ